MTNRGSQYLCNIHINLDNAGQAYYQIRSRAVGLTDPFIIGDKNLLDYRVVRATFILILRYDQQRTAGFMQ